MTETSDSPLSEKRFRPYDARDLTVCLTLFDANCPDSFAPNERDHYERFLRDEPPGYEVCFQGGQVVGAYGLTTGPEARAKLDWILLDPAAQGSGVGSAMMKRVVERARGSGVGRIMIAASHLSEPFFARFGATTVTTTKNGWGEGMHRHDMILEP